MTKWMAAGRGIASGLLDCFFPPHCCACALPLPDAGTRLLCQNCHDRLAATRLNAPLCMLCGRPLSADANSPAVLCLNCRITVPHFSMARALFPYHGPAGAVVKAFKYSDQYHLGADLLGEGIRSGWFPDFGAGCEAVMPVPLHRRRKRRRGFNQAELLAKEVAGHMGKPLSRSLLVRVRDTRSQTTLSARGRVKNVKDAFAARGAGMPESVLLIDDVFTTGATANECAKTLKRAGCTDVRVFTLVRTVE